MPKKTRGSLRGGSFLGGFDGLPYTRPYGAGGPQEKGDEPFRRPPPGSICDFPVVVRPHKTSDERDALKEAMRAVRKKPRPKPKRRRMPRAGVKPTGAT